jgi:flagellin-like hook-associated protein FlgL
MISDQINVHIARELGGLDREHRVHVKKLSAGKRILMPGDDAGGYSLAVKHGSAGRRNQAMLTNLQNVYSYAQTQDGVLASVGKMYKRMDELATMAMDPTKTDADRALCDKEFQELRETAVRANFEEFNGLRLFRGKLYELVNKGTAINWTDSKAEADALDAGDSNNSYYLATITSETEQAEIGLQIGDVGINAWLGGNDVTVEGEWRWTEGPEGLEDGGKGKKFWQGDKNGSAVNGSYENWGSGEPNNSGDEDFLQISQVLQPDGTRARWNDLPDTNTSGNTYQPKGYVLEVDQGDLEVGKDREGKTFGLKHVDFQKYLSSDVISIATIAKAQAATVSMKGIIENISDSRAIVGANLSRISSEIENLRRIGNSYESALSRVEDLDVAGESGRLAQKSIKLQSSSALLAQANEIMNPNLIQVLLE